MPPGTLSTPPDTAEKSQRKKKPPKPYGKVNPAALVALAEANPHLSQRQLAKLSDVDVAAINRALKRYGIQRETLEEFKGHRADIFAGVQQMVIESLSVDDIKKASVRDRTILFGTMYDKERLERGLSTSNNLMVYASAIESACKPQDVVVEGNIVDVESVSVQENGNTDANKCT